MSCTDVQTIQAGNGTKTQFSFDFPYIFKSEIHVYFWNVTTKEYDEVLTTDATYPWQITDANPTIVEFTSTAPPAPAVDPAIPGEALVDNVKIRRITQIDDIRALFNPGSAIRSDDLNKNFEQLRYAIQESNCPGIPDDVDAYLKAYYWDRFDNTIYSTDSWRSDDATIASTAALDQRFQDEVNDTFTKAELAAASDVMPDDDVAVPTTGAVKNFVDHVIETDVLVDNTGLNKTGSNGQVTIGISADSVDFDRIKNVDKVQLADQIADYDLAGGDDKVFTSSAAIRRFENFVQNSTPTTTAGIGKGRIWVDVDDDLTLSVWNGSNWVGITSGGTFTNQPKVVYVDASSGDDANDGHRISRPKKTIKAAVNQINGDSLYGDGSVVVVAAGVYQEAAPIQIQKKNVSIIGQALRSCIVHPTVATQGDQSSGNHALFELNSGSFIQNLTLTGMKAGSGTGNSVDSELPANQGWNFAFYSGATITKSPYIQNCTNFSDSEIDNSNLNANTPAGGAAGDTDSAPTGGGLLVDGSVVNSASPLRSMVCDSYTHVGLNGPGILVTNNGYCQATSSYAFFNKYHIKTLNGGQANLAASTTDFGEKALVADGKSTAAIFTSNVDGAAADASITFNINQPTAGAGWFGNTQRPATNMLVEVNSVIYPILSATPNTDSEGGNGWTVTISRPDPSNRSTNLGLNGAISDNAAVSFYLRSMIASSGHTMEYVGSGTDYRALPENGGVPDDTKQKTELNNGKIWTATTDHNGKFTIGGNQTDDPIFEVDQQLGFVTIPEGSIAFNLLSDLTPQLGGDLDVNGKKITGLGTPVANDEAAPKSYVDTQIAGIDELVEDTTPQLGGDLDVNSYQIVSTSNGNIVLNPDGTGSVDVSTSRITSVTDPTSAQDAATKNYVDNFAIVTDTTPQLGGDLDANGNDIILDTGTAADPSLTFTGDLNTGIYSPGADQVAVATNGTGRLFIQADGDIGLATSTPNLAGFAGPTISIGKSANPYSLLELQGSNSSDGSVGIIQAYNSAGTSRLGFISFDRQGANNSGAISFHTWNAGSGSEKLRITSDGKVGIGTSSPQTLLNLRAASGNAIIRLENSNTTIGASESLGAVEWYANDSSAGGTAVAGKINVVDENGFGTAYGMGFYTGTVTGGTYSLTEKLRIDDQGRVGIGSTAPARQLTVYDSSAPVIQLVNSTTGQASSDGVMLYESGSNFVIENQEAGEIQIYNNGSQRAVIDSSGRLLVGTSVSDGVIDSKTQIIGLQALHLHNGLSGNDGAILNFSKSRNTTYGSHTVVQNNDKLGQIVFRGDDGTDYATPGALISAEVDSTPGSNDMPGRLVFSTTADGASSPTEGMRLRSNGILRVPGIYNSTAATGANVWVASDGDLGRSTSSIKYKTDVETLQDQYADALLQCRPVWYRSTCKVDNPSWGWWGFIAEEVAEIDPRLVHWKTSEQVVQEDGSIEPVLLENPEPEGVQYERFVPHLLNLIKRQKEQIEAMEARLSALEAS